MLMSIPGALKALQRPAQFREFGRVVSIAGPDMLSHATPVRTVPALALEQLPNGNALPYADLYGIPDVPTIFRGTYRYRGFSAIMQDCVALGLLSTASLPPNVDIKQWSQLLELVLHDNNPTDKQLGQHTTAFFAWIGDQVPTQDATTYLQAFANVLEQRLSMDAEDRDLVVLTHAVEVDIGDGTVEVHSASLMGYVRIACPGKERETA
ncbi:hypothetical protein DYB37_007846 [Aphanomyces astaci]|uniref:Saccharopine dehydrogenase-like C-terminal domain-containing protein n=1 Tax=Aphanomyces astaci TaxID=112090 RepID=A0A3R7BWV2_APHAT|nr:hypothetical protein DYB35_008073 [Aphanomyces astaci]RHZ25913.1 hypothetical protein DYB37_007846 [Aphanomyces astaci]